LWTAAKERGKSKGREKVKPFYVYVDEFRNFVTPTIAKNLDQARGFGLHLTLAHQFPNQLLHTEHTAKQVYDSVFVNARSKVVFGMEGEENLKPLAQSLFFGVMNPDKIKHELYSTKVMGYVEEYRSAYSRTRSEGHGHGKQTGHAEGKGTGGTAALSQRTTRKNPHTANRGASSEQRRRATAHPVLKRRRRARANFRCSFPSWARNFQTSNFENMEEQLFRAMAVLFDQEQRRCIARTVGSREPESLFTPTVKDVPQTVERTERYTEKLLKRWPFALRTLDARKELAAREKQIAERFLRRPELMNRPARSVEFSNSIPCGARRIQSVAVENFSCTRREYLPNNISPAEDPPKSTRFRRYFSKPLTSWMFQLLTGLGGGGALYY
jgi:hypothetical protein